MRAKYDESLEEEEHEEERLYPQDTHPDLYEEHVGMTQSMLQRHIAPLVHDGFSAAELTSGRVEEALGEVLYHQVSECIVHRGLDSSIPTPIATQASQMSVNEVMRGQFS
jgi:hypothetical protein